jgi:xylan 1,4-beta-xylosidase
MDTALPGEERTEDMHVDEQPAQVEIDCRRALGPLRRIWASFGYDELNWTATPRGTQNLATLQGLMETPYSVRAHNIYTSGPGRGLPHWSSGNVYHEDAAGAPCYDWTTIDPAFDAWVRHGCRPIVELGFCPRALVPPDAALAFTPMPSLYGAYEAGLWAWPPRDLGRWHDLVAATVRHACERYGKDVVATWYWEVWNEPDIAYWQGTFEDYCRLYDVSVAAVTSVLPEARVGGPATTGGGAAFLERFLAHCADGANAASGGRGARLDFVSFHTKGAAFHPWRTYGPIGAEGAETPARASPSTRKMLSEVRAGLDVIARSPRFHALPVLVDECDASVPAHWGIYDNANFGYRTSAYYPVFQVQLMKKILDLDELGLARVHAATTWSWYFEGDRYFEGTRSLFTAANLATPLLNAYRMLARLPEQRVSATSDRGRGLTQLDDATDRAEVDAIAAVAGRDRVAALVWHHCDDQYRTGSAAVRVTFRQLPFAGRSARLRHYRIDHAHSNSHAAWVALGRPQDPSPEQLTAIRARAALESCAPDQVIDRAPADVVASFDLPLPGVSLLEIIAQ